MDLEEPTNDKGGAPAKETSPSGKSSTENTVAERAPADNTNDAQVTTPVTGVDADPPTERSPWWYEKSDQPRDNEVWEWTLLATPSATGRGFVRRVVSWAPGTYRSRVYRRLRHLYERGLLLDQTLWIAAGPEGLMIFHPGSPEQRAKYRRQLKHIAWAIGPFAVVDDPKEIGQRLTSNLKLGRHDLPGGARGAP